MKNWNVGMATALMANLDTASYYTFFVTTATDTSDVVFSSSTSLYLTGGFNLVIFMNSINVVLIKLMQQYEYCGINELYIMYDQIMSNITEISGLCANLILMIALGWS